MNLMLKKLMAVEKEMGAEEWFSYIVEKLKEWLIEVEDYFSSEAGQENLKHWLIAAAIFIVGALVLIPLLWCCCVCLVACVRGCCHCLAACLGGCCRGLGGCLYGCCRGLGRCLRGCCRRGSGAVRMMRAPGRYPALMPRHVFEANPRSYFLNLRGSTSSGGLV